MYYNVVNRLYHFKLLNCINPYFNRDTMPKEVKSSTARSYRPEWERTFTWLSSKSNIDGVKVAFCNVCKCELIHRLCNIKRHDTSQTHRDKAPKKDQIFHHSLQLRKQRSL